MVVVVKEFKTVLKGYGDTWVLETTTGAETFNTLARPLSQKPTGRRQEPVFDP